MVYTPEQQANFLQEQRSAVQKLSDLQRRFIVEGEAYAHTRVHEHLVHGVGRRLTVMRKSLQNIYELFPVDCEQALPLDVLADVQINLHAFLMNVAGLFENCAWAFVLRHGLDSHIPEMRVSLFSKETKRHLPAAIRDYLAAEPGATWQREYLKAYRDALAHRVPPYIPPFLQTEQQAADDRAISARHLKHLQAGELDLAMAAAAELLPLRRTPAFFFIHSLSALQSKAIRLHPQVICDVLSGVQFCELFLDNWHLKSQPAAPQAAA